MGQQVLGYLFSFVPHCHYHNVVPSTAPPKEFLSRSNTLDIPSMIVGIAYYNWKDKPSRAFWASSLSIVGLCGTVASSLFPNMIPALGKPEWSLTVANASSSQLTLTVMLILTLIGMPFVVGYTIWIYRTFKAKVNVEAELHY